MRFSVITANYNGAAFLETTLQSVLQQRGPAIDLEYIVVDGQSTDGSHAILERYQDQIDHVIIEPDTGPANAINKGFARATGDIVSWLNADDIYYPQTLLRVKQALSATPKASFCFGKCPIINENGDEVRRPITRFKEMFFPVSSRFVFQSINYVSQPSVFFRRAILDQGRPYLREDLVAAWDYEFFLRLWRQGPGHCLSGPPLAAFRWHESSISGTNYRLQFKEELAAAVDDAGKWSIQALLHTMVRHGIVGAYTAMALLRDRSKAKARTGV